MKKIHLVSTFYSLLLVTSSHEALAAKKAAPGSAQSGAHPKTAAVAQASAPGSHAARASGKPVGRNAARNIVASRAESFSVVGLHKSRSTSVVVGSDLIAKSVPGSNPLKVLAQMPGVMFQSDDPLGLDTWSNQFYMHGFFQDQIGMTLDGIPLGDQEFHSMNGLNSVAAITSENVSRMDATMSAGAEDTASTSNLGGAVAFHSSDPSHKMGAKIVQTFGSNDMFHTYFRGDSGDLNAAGSRFYVSYARNDTHKWKGGGNQFSQQVNAKFVQPVGESSSISAYFDWSDIELYNYQDMSFDMLKNGGYDIDNFIGTRNAYAKAYRSALSANALPGGSLPAGYEKMSDPWDASYYDGGTLSRDYLGGMNFHFLLTNRLSWDSVVYGHGQYMRGTWASPYMASPNGAPLIDQMTLQHSQRGGFTTALHYDIAHNHISTGIWYEGLHASVGRAAFQEPLLGEGAPVNSLGSLPAPFATLWGEQINSNSLTGFAEDTYSPLPNLALHFGFRSLLQTARAGDTQNLESYTGTSALASGSITTAKAFLPHISADWHFLKHHELFFDITENVKSYPLAAYKQGASPFALSQSTFNLLQKQGGLKPETDWNYAVGYRFSDTFAQASIYAYHTNFKNRLQQITSGTIVNPISTVANVGGVTMNGVDAGLTLTPIRGLSIYNSISYNHATYDNNLSEPGVVYQLKGQQIVSYPRLMYKNSLSYTWRDFDAHFDTSYVGTRNFSYTGDMKVPHYWVESLGARYHFGKTIQKVSPLKDLTFEFNVYNLTNVKYISTMGENGLPMTGDYQSFLVGAPRQYFGTIRAGF
ncbi:TonB-dependent receptor [Acetobacter sp. TBRC 12305]|uniref:TonB-dependent receptor n=1 Tax=Acetobacter garciniae TaxID=2817435 RepID=A0A939KQ79_9PROT|nr:TonB-dependent receptor [Acetobacter garciniae]MBO1324957.1 TonB-dependent receptor [Acetobacter garciniae]MBX0344648.1 TonB-dependent receptor [Acetobacter garciniae]